MKNPAVDTSFLPDRDREERERIEREELRKEWLARQDKMKNETIEVTYSYWDGSGHRKSVEVSLSWFTAPLAHNLDSCVPIVQEGRQHRDLFGKVQSSVPGASWY